VYRNVSLSLTASTGGSAMYSFEPGRIASNGTSSGISFIVSNNSAAYIPTSTVTTGTWAYTAGPLAPQTTAGTIEQIKVTGMTIDLVPFTSFNTSQGGYLVTPMQQQISYSLNAVPDVYIINTPFMSLLPSTMIYDFKTTSRVNMIPSSNSDDCPWTSITNIPTVSRDYGKVLIQIVGAASAANINAKVTLTWAVVPDPGQSGFIKGSIPEMGAATDKFCEYLKTRYPNIIHWNEEHLLALYEQLNSIGSDKYDDLVRITHDTKYKPSSHTLSTIGNNNNAGESLVLEDL